MRKLFLCCIPALFCLLNPVHASGLMQSGQDGEEVRRHFRRAEIALSLAKEPADYLEAAREYEALKVLLPEDAMVRYSLGVCYEMAGQSAPEYYTRAAAAYSDALRLGRGSLNAQLLAEIGDKAARMKEYYAYTREAALNTISPASLCGSWIYHSASGETDELYNIVISESHGTYLVRYLMRRAENTSLDPYMFRDTDIVQEGNTVKFSVVHNKSVYTGVRESYWFKIAMSYELVLVDGELRGIAEISDVVEALGNADYATVSRAMRNGEGTVLKDCHGSCGVEEVRFTRM